MQLENITEDILVLVGEYLYCQKLFIPLEEIFSIISPFQCFIVTISFPNRAFINISSLFIIVSILKAKIIGYLWFL